MLCKHEGLSRALLTSALQGAKDVSQMSFVLLKQLVANEEQRKQMMEARALQAACRAVKSDKPEVSCEQPTRTGTGTTADVLQRLTYMWGCAVLLL